MLNKIISSITKVLDFSSNLFLHFTEQVDINLGGELPKLSGTARVQVQPFNESYSWINNALLVSGSGMVSVDGQPLKTAWKLSIRSDNINTQTSTEKGKLQILTVSGMRLFYRAQVKQLYFMGTSSSFVKDVAVKASDAEDPFKAQFQQTTKENLPTARPTTVPATPEEATTLIPSPTTLPATQAPTTTPQIPTKDILTTATTGEISTSPAPVHVQQTAEQRKCLC